MSEVSRSAAQVLTTDGKPLRWSVQEPSVQYLRQLQAAAGDPPDVLDVNLWFALAVQEHPHHAAAVRYWERRFSGRSPEVVAQALPCMVFCRVTLLGLFRLLCQPKAMGQGVLSVDSAWRVVQGFLQTPGIGLLGDAASLEAELTALLAVQSPLPARLITDAYLAAFAQSAVCRLVTFDRDFLRFGLAACEVLDTA